MKVWNLNIKRGADGSKHVDIQLHGVIDGGWLDEEGVSTAAIAAELNQHLDAKTVTCRINSVGGSAFGGVALYNILSSHPGAVTCVVEGLAASAASLVAMAGTTLMGRGSMMMIHSPSTVAMGNAEELRKTADVLDKVQSALTSIYTAKTGKSADEVNGLLDAETWMTAEEAVAAGFANGIAGESAEVEPDPDDPNEGNEPPEDRGQVIHFRGVDFPRATLPQQIVAMAREPAAPPAPPALAVQAESTPPPVLSLVPALEPPPPITRAELVQREPALVEALLAEGRAAGAAAERARLQAIDDLGIKGCGDLVAAAKYSAPCTAAELAVAVVKAGQHAGAELLANRRTESSPLTGVAPVAPDQTAQAAERRVIQAIVDGYHSRRGGSVR